ncbi:DUF6165 family protein [uncultured Rhodoblastus sp.]|uniref:DUF6165 family protein n=1 Tax=uncultured Rhodoblastus sp. TaxID=543037 RepID=UPI0025D3CE5E|nr:DUF6165 family protein [uncultured Rhodoblastus sp.]
MKLVAEISAGELIDKITILEIKLDLIGDEAKRANVAREYAALTGVWNREIGETEDLARLRGELKAVNAKLWHIEDEIRAQEKAGTFGAEFIALARAVYHTNDSRAALKREINRRTQSDLIEEKSYEAY